MPSRRRARSSASTTVSRDSNLELIHFVRDELARHGVASRLTFDDERTKANLFATIGAGKPAGVIVSGHTDTVPWDDQDWSVDPLGAEVRDGRLYGPRQRRHEGLHRRRRRAGAGAGSPPSCRSRSISRSATTRRSAASAQQRLIADMRERGVQPLACIVGEPTGMVPALAHKGVYRWRCCVRGHAAHSSLTPQAVNAIEVGARVIGKLTDMAERWRDGDGATKASTCRTRPDRSA